MGYALRLRSGDIFPEIINQKLIQKQFSAILAYLEKRE
jgi:hypothetical protein